MGKQLYSITINFLTKKVAAGDSKCYGGTGRSIGRKKFGGVAEIREDQTVPQPDLRVEGGILHKNPLKKFNKKYIKRVFFTKN